MMSAAVILLVSPTIAFGAGCLELSDDKSGIYYENGTSTKVGFVTSFLTAITKQDTVNSSGVPLSGFRSMIQQDRANVNRFGKIDTYVDSEPDENGKLIEWSISDDKDGFFVTPERRAMLQDMEIVFACDGNFLPDDHVNSENFKFWTDAIEAGEVPGFLHLVVFNLPKGNLAMHLNFVG